MTEELPRRIKYLLHEANHDCFFVVGPENGPTERIGAVKPLLMADSEPFRSMLRDSHLAETGDIRVKDVEPETFMNFLKCVYGASHVIIPKLSFEKGEKLLYVMEKYLVNEIKLELITHMESVFTFEKIFFALTSPIIRQKSGLSNIMRNYLRFSFDKITKDKRFLQLSDSAISWILKQNYISVKEIEIWNAVLRWAFHKSGYSDDGEILRTNIIGFFKYIRFLTMDYTEFWGSVVSSKLLTADEINDICSAYAFRKSCTIEYLCSNRINRYNIEMVSKNIDSCIVTYAQSAFIHCSIKSINDFHFGYSNSHPWGQHFWCLEVSKLKNQKEVDYLGVFVKCKGKTSDWNCTVDGEVILINQCGYDNITKYFTTNTYTPKNDNWGFSYVYKWNLLLDPFKGFIKDNSIILMVKLNESIESDY